METLTVGVIWALSLINLLVGFALGRKSLPDIYEQSQGTTQGSLADRIKAAMPGGGKGEVTTLSETQLAELERIKNEWDKPHDPNDGVPGYPGS